MAIFCQVKIALQCLLVSLILSQVPPEKFLLKAIIPPHLLPLAGQLLKLLPLETSTTILVYIFSSILNLNRAN